MHPLVRELIDGLPYATFSVEQWVDKCHAYDYKAISVPISIATAIAKHPSCSKTISEFRDKFPWCTGFYINGFEIKHNTEDRYYFYKLVEEN